MYTEKKIAKNNKKKIGETDTRGNSTQPRHISPNNDFAFACPWAYGEMLIRPRAQVDTRPKPTHTRGSPARKVRELTEKGSGPQGPGGNPPETSQTHTDPPHGVHTFAQRLTDPTTRADMFSNHPRYNGLLFVPSWNLRLNYFPNDSLQDGCLCMCIGMWTFARGPWDPSGKINKIP